MFRCEAKEGWYAEFQTVGTRYVFDVLDRGENLLLSSDSWGFAASTYPKAELLAFAERFPKLMEADREEYLDLAKEIGALDDSLVECARRRSRSISGGRISAWMGLAAMICGARIASGLLGSQADRGHIAASDLLEIDLDAIKDIEELRTLAHEMQAQLMLFDMDNERLAEAWETK